MRALIALALVSACWVGVGESIPRPHVIRMHDQVACIPRNHPPPMIPCRGDLITEGEGCACPSPRAGCYQVVDCRDRLLDDDACEEAMQEAWRRWSNESYQWINLWAWPRCADLD